MNVLRVPALETKPEVVKRQSGKFSILIVKPAKALAPEASRFAHQGGPQGFHFDGPTNL